ncbi:hypothetical protein KSP39_PZI002205 [Platanthera zijinensis]|uniref:Uncharacterized protein n=1 Tax=Platanthera zijinensis TaxID=2320716 RepID=A0AAP0BZ06_9ASPA
MLLKLLGYETACVPSNMADNKIGYIQSPNISKACTRVLKVKCKYFLICLYALKIFVNQVCNYSDSF